MTDKIREQIAILRGESVGDSERPTVQELEEILDRSDLAMRVQKDGSVKSYSIDTLETAADTMQSLLDENERLSTKMCGDLNACESKSAEIERLNGSVKSARAIVGSQNEAMRQAAARIALLEEVVEATNEYLEADGSITNEKLCDALAKLEKSDE